MEQEKDMCCPKFNPIPWENKEIVWQDKLFIKDTVPCLFHIPLSMGKTMERMWKKVEKAQAFNNMDEWMLLSDEENKWKSYQYMAVTKEVTDAENVKISGKFLTKVFEGPYKMVPIWFKDFSTELKNKNIIAKKYYLFYTTCPKCAKKYGKNYVVLFAKIE